MKKKLLLLLAITITMLAAQSFAHSGRTDQNGGHWDHKTGTYHYH